jgi:hypothetical protein
MSGLSASDNYFAIKIVREISKSANAQYRGKRAESHRIHEHRSYPCTSEFPQHGQLSHPLLSPSRQKPQLNYFESSLLDEREEFPNTELAQAGGPQISAVPPVPARAHFGQDSFRMQQVQPRHW